MFKNERIWTFPAFNSFFVVVICDNPRTTNNGQLTDLYLQFLGAKRCKWSPGNLLRQLAAGNILRHCYLLINLYYNLHYKIQLIFYQLYTSKYKKLGETRVATTMLLRASVLENKSPFQQDIVKSSLQLLFLSF